ncbi:lipid IV(A) 3-deoxy-D-manno-octulosonic acid transferase [Arcobacter sp. CECT 8985]|uniref:lipid IV(A) 3-deoxy-D-manno-octulosonic acid transferase n=1 Tax=Arcobacter sp. CECT 8985 TaxID=1935424 RepID=UPI002159EA4F|nr:lipid IV(A) 3-deoxy-D-manno-octulosonic acid transferase [Arcobacter sp. CECT 8985]
MPLLLIKLKNKKYQVAIPSKFFLKNNPKFDNEDKIWFHSCSMGETIAIKPLIKEFSDCNISVITNTGYEEACKHSKNVRYLPYELFLPFWINKQKALVVMEAELWFMLFYIVKRKGGKTFLINARISDKSYNSYRKMRWFYKYIFKNIDKVFAQSETDKQRLEYLGAKNIDVIGNIKLAQLPKITKKFEKTKQTLITAGSTHEKEEELILNSYDRKFGKLVIVPRHPERFEKVNNLIKNYCKEKNLKYHRFSQNESFDSDIILVDKMGELNNIYAISDVVILGGGFEKIGGHNPVEPAFFGCKIISGKEIFNQKSLFECIDNYYLVQNDELRNYLEKIDELKIPKLAKAGSVEPIIKELKNV